MRRFSTLLVLLFLSVPLGISISGCGSKTSVVYCNSGSDSGTVVGQLTTITLDPVLTGISLNEGQIGAVSTPRGADCKGNPVTVSTLLYGTTDKVNDASQRTIDVSPNGQLCAGSWNRYTGGGIPDYTVCNVTGKTGAYFVVASAQGVSSNPLPVFVHPVITSILLGPASTNCTSDLATNCCPITNIAVISAPPYDPNSCLSQNTTGALAGRVYAGSGAGQTNISCAISTSANGQQTYSPLAGHLTFAPQNADVVTIDPNGIATAKNPGSTLVTATLSNAGSGPGFFSTCPPRSIALTALGQTSANVNQNSTIPLSATVVDTKGNTLSGVSLRYVSTTPTTLPGGGGSVTPTLPGAGAITALCLPPACNSSPLNEIGFAGNGTPISSNPVTITTAGVTGTVLYVGSTQSLYLQIIDFTASTIGATARLPYLPNSMILSEDTSTLYMGSSTELMVLSSTGAVTRVDANTPGTVLAVSPDNTTVVVADPVRQLVSLESAGGVSAQIGGLATHAEFSPDSGTVYISAGNQLLVHSNFTGWSTIPLSTPALDVAVTVPSVGAYLAGAVTTGRSYCPSTTFVNTSGQATTVNQFYPLADTAAVVTDRLAATDDGHHVLGAHAAGANASTLVDLAFLGTNSSGTANSSGLPIGACPTVVPANYFTAQRTGATNVPLAGVNASAITGVLPTSDSTTAFVTYTGTGPLPAYTPATGAIVSIPLTGGATAPVSGVISSDNSTFYVGTAGDNSVHLVTRSSTGFSDTSTVQPKLADPNGNVVVPNLLAQRPRRTT